MHVMVLTLFATQEPYQRFAGGASGAPTPGRSRAAGDAGPLGTKRVLAHWIRPLTLSPASCGADPAMVDTNLNFSIPLRCGVHLKPEANRSFNYEPLAYCRRCLWLAHCRPCRGRRSLGRRWTLRHIQGWAVPLRKQFPIIRVSLQDKRRASVGGPLKPVMTVDERRSNATASVRVRAAQTSIPVRMTSLCPTYRVCSNLSANPRVARLHLCQVESAGGERRVQGRRARTH